LFIAVDQPIVAAIYSDRTERRINYNMKLSKHLRRPISEFSISEQKYKYNNRRNTDTNKSIHCDVKPVN